MTSETISNAERCKRWRAANKEKQRAYSARYREEHRDELRELNRAWRAANPEMMAAAVARYSKENRDVKRRLQQQRRSRMRGAVPSWFGELDELVMAEAADLAKRREAATGVPWHIDHAIPLQARAACGLHVAQNIQVIPERINAAKSNRMIFTEPGEWLRAT